MPMNLSYTLTSPETTKMIEAQESIAKAISNLPGNAGNAAILDATFGAMLDGTNTTAIFWKWWEQSGANGDSKYERLSRFARMAAQAWGGKKYTLRSFNQAVSGESAMTPLDDLADKTAAQLCTEETEAVTDWADEDPMTWYIRANALSLADGTMDVLAVEGEDGFDLSGETAPVYTFALALWVKESSDGNYNYISFATTQPDDTYYPMAGDVAPDNTKRDLTWHPTFPGGLNSEGALTSGAGLPPYNYASANNGLTAARKWNAYEGLWNDCDTKWLLWMWQLRHFNLENSGILDGCQSYSASDTAAVAETNVSRVLVTKGNGANYIVGSNVSVGEMAEESTKDRSTVTKTPIALNALIGSITTATVDGTEYDAINLLVDAPFSTTTTCMIFSMPYYSGDTEALPGHKDGCRGSLTAGQTPLRVAGVEVIDGAYTLGLDPLYSVSWDAESKTGMYKIFEQRDSEKLAGAVTNYRDTGLEMGPIGSSWHYVKEFLRTKLGVLFPSIVDNGASSSTYYKSAFNGAYSSGVRAPWRFGYLYGNAYCGLACEAGYNTPSNAGWYSRPRLCGSGKKRGEWQGTVQP